MLGDGTEVDRGATLACDVCIIGAGAAGISLAQELVRTQLDVILLESGGTTVERSAQSLNVGELLGAPQFPTAASRLRMLGGSTGHWTGMCRPLDDFDFEKRKWVPNSGWPISGQDLDPYYTRAHSICELGPNDYTARAWQRVLDAEPEFATLDVGLKLIQLSPPTRFGSRYRKELEAATNLRVLLHSTVTEIIPNTEARNIHRVNVQTIAGHGFQVRARAFVLACGGIENPRLLLLSTSAMPTGLGNDSGWVGRCFMDHPAAQPLGLLLLLRNEARRLVQEQEVASTRVMVGLGLGYQTQQSEELLNNVLYVGPPRPLEELATLPVMDRQTMRFVHRASGVEPPVYASNCWLRSEQAPNPESRVTLSDQIDYLGQRRVRLDWRLTDLDYDNLARSARLYIRALGAANLGRVKLVPWLVQKPPQWWRHVKPGWHHMGTTRMAHDATRGVVDSSSKVFGIDNLFVAGSSVFPTGGFANPTLTIVALATRLADHLKQWLV